jgi:hypothetical protein
MAAAKGAGRPENGFQFQTDDRRVPARDVLWWPYRAGGVRGPDEALVAAFISTSNRWLRTDRLRCFS